jgi:hypothetical protein
MKRLNAIGKFSVLCLVLILWTACGPAEWKGHYVSGHGYEVHFEMPKPFKRTEEPIHFEETGRTLYENGYVTYGDEDHKFQVRVMEQAVANWRMDNVTPRSLLEYALGRENAGADKMLEVHEFMDPNWPDTVSPAEEFTIESADGETIRHTRVVIYEAPPGRESYGCYVLFTASRPKDEPRSVDVDRFFNSLKICTYNKSPGHC